MNEQPILVQPAATPSKSTAITAMVLGISSFVFGLVGILSIPLGIAAVVVGIVAIRRQAGKGMAIAGVITGSIGLVVGLISILLVLIAVPSLQRGQQDVVVRNDASVAISAVNTYRSNNQGNLPTNEEFSSAEFKRMYMNDVTSDLRYSPGKSCNGSQAEKKYSVTTTLGNGEEVCLDS